MRLHTGLRAALEEGTVTQVIPLMSIKCLTGNTHTWGALVAASNSGDKEELEKLPRGTNILINLIMDLFTYEKNKHHLPEMLLELGILEISAQVNVPKPKPWVNKY